LAGTEKASVMLVYEDTVDDGAAHHDLEVEAEVGEVVY
jgi:hypothetical protein